MRISNPSLVRSFKAALALIAALAAGCSHASNQAPSVDRSAAGQRAAAARANQKDLARLQNMQNMIQNNPRVPAQIKAQTMAGLSNQIQAEQREGGH